MKKIILAYISTACIIVGCTITKTIAQSVVRPTYPYNAHLAISPSGNTKNPMIALSSISSFDQIFPDLNPAMKTIKGLNISSARIESSDPSKKNLGMFKSIKMYIYTSMPGGSNKLLIVSSTNVSKNAGSSLILSLDEGVIGDKTINSDQIDPNASIEQALLGRLAGVQVSPSGEIRIRGVNNLSGGGSPLFVIDGIERNSLQGLNPGDVESIEVLKDASQLAMYGMRGANGVIRVKTKSGYTNSKKDTGSLDNFVKGSTMRVRFEYVLRYVLTSETGLNVNIYFR